MKLLNYLIVAVLCIIFGVVGLLNSGSVAFNYIWATQTMPLVMVMLICFILGALMILVLFGTQSLYWRQRAKSLQNQIERERREAERAEIRAEFHADQKTV
ncbi:MAG: LapA family protein [Cardiobacteriaceae bacterium]|nr:LapA family protein [Cardiobacteriaceae bacterium]